MSRHTPSVFAAKDSSEDRAEAPRAKEPENDRRTSFAAESVKKARERFKNFSLSKFSVDAMAPNRGGESVKEVRERFENVSLSQFPVDAMPSNYVPSKRELPAAERNAHVHDFQRKKIDQQLKKFSKADSPNRGLKLALPTDAVKTLLPSYKDETLELNELLHLISRHMRGTEFFNRGNPTLNRMTLQARVRETLGLDDEVGVDDEETAR
jgi:hypothetical protein